MAEKVKTFQAYEWVKTGHWNRKQFTDWYRDQIVFHQRRYAELAEEMERMCEFTRELQNHIASSVVVSTDAVGYIEMNNTHEDDPDVVMLDSIEDAV